MSVYGRPIQQLKREAERRHELEDPARARFYKISMLTSVTALVLALASLLRR